MALAGCCLQVLQLDVKAGIPTGRVEGVSIQIHGDIDLLAQLVGQIQLSLEMIVARLIIQMQVVNLELP